MAIPTKIRLAGSKRDAQHMAFNLRTSIRGAEYYKTKRGWVVRTFDRKHPKKRKM